MSVAASFPYSQCIKHIEDISQRKCVIVIDQVWLVAVMLNVTH